MLSANKIWKISQVHFNYHDENQQSSYQQKGRFSCPSTEHETHMQWRLPIFFLPSCFADQLTSSKGKREIVFTVTKISKTHLLKAYISFEQIESDFSFHIFLALVQTEAYVICFRAVPVAIIHLLSKFSWQHLFDFAHFLWTVKEEKACNLFQVSWNSFLFKTVL